MTVMKFEINFTIIPVLIVILLGSDLSFSSFRAVLLLLSVKSQSPCALSDKGS